MRYFFDTRDGPEFFRDQEGLELDGIQSARDQATQGLTDLAKDVLRNSERRELSIEVRDGHNSPLFRAALSFEVLVLAGEPGLLPRPWTAT